MTDTTVLEKPRTLRQDVWDQFRTHKGALVGLAVFVLILIAVIFGPYVWRLDPGFVDPNPVNMLKLRNQGPSLEHPFGTDQLGRDMLARMMAGGKVSIAVGMTAMFLSLFLGTLIGAIHGNDLPMVQTITFIFAVLIVLFNLIADILYGILDPRIRYD